MNNNEPIPFAYPFIRKEEEDAVLGVLRSGWLTTGAQALAFEKEFAAFMHNKRPLYCLAVNSATSGLHLCLEAFGIQKGDMVLVPSYTFTASAEIIRYLGADPVFVDSGPRGFNIDPCSIERAIINIKNKKNPYTEKKDQYWQEKTNRKIKAIIPVHYGGLVCDMQAINDIARKYNLYVIEDAAHAFPSLSSFGWAGTIADAGVFSFYATKTLAAGEGGLVACHDENTVKRISIMRSHGIDRSVWNRYTDINSSWYYEVIEAGFKYNLPDILAALGRVQLSRAEQLHLMRKNIAAKYDTAFADNAHFTIPPTGSGDARHLYPLRLNLDTLKISRNEFIFNLQKNGIGVSVHFIPLHTMPFYKKHYNIPENSLPNSINSFNQEISLPIWPGMSDKQINRVIDQVRQIAQDYSV
jgi:dTDP-4-amino-4,6-dideoxygalactose transaminase